MFAQSAFFSFVELTDVRQHRLYNEWHQLDHRPENLALPGVAWGDRWARPAEYKAQSTSAPVYAHLDYAAMYWFREPLAESLQAWSDLAEDSFQWGRGPIIPGVERRLTAFFRPVKGYSAARVLVSPDVLPFRPNRGLHLTVTEYEEPHSLETHARFEWEDRELIPSLLDVPGVAGAWTFSFTNPQRHPTMPLNGTDEAAPGSTRIRLLYLDDDPLLATPAVDQRVAESRAARGATAHDTVEHVLLSTPLKTIIPWQDW